MKLTVTKFLNVRVGKPSTNAPNYQYLAPGSTVEVDGVLYEGKGIDGSYEGNNKWYKDEFNNYYWSGGFEINELQIGQPQLSSNFPWWIKDYQIDKYWNLGVTGNGIKIAVLDTGIFIPNDFIQILPEFILDVTDSSDFGVDRKFGHGTHCIGIIKANNEIARGVAFNSILYSIKITHEFKGDKDYYMEDGILKAIELGVDIISISKGDSNPKPAVKLAIDKAINKGILVIAAAGNNDQNNPSEKLFFPARYDTTLSVGGFDENKQPLSDTISIEQPDIFAPGKINSSHINNRYVLLTGSSQATAYMAGICALLLEYYRKTEPTFKAIRIKQVILDSAEIINQLKTFRLKSIIN